MTRRPLPRLRRRQRGFSLLELSVVIVVLGLVGIVLVRWAQTAGEVQRQAVERDLLQRADDALLAYVMLNSRLPCPAADMAGNEDCAGARAVGWLPYATLGLPDARAGRLRYGVLRRASATGNDDADLTRALDRLWPMQVSSSGSATVAPLGNRNGLDFCQALRTAMRADADAGQVHTLDAAGANAGNVAYALASASAPDPLAATHQGNALAFASPRASSGPSYHDQVRAVGTDQLWTRMRCGDNLGAAGYAHPNLAAAATINTLALEDYKKQLEIALKLSQANLASATAAAVSVGGGLAGDIAADTTDSVAETIETLGAMAAHVALSTTAIVMNSIAIGAAAAFLTTAAITESKAQEIYSHADRPLNLSRQIEPTVVANAKADDAMGLYIDP